MLVDTGWGVGAPPGWGVIALLLLPLLLGVYTSGEKGLASNGTTRRSVGGGLGGVVVVWFRWRASAAAACGGSFRELAGGAWAGSRDNSGGAGMGAGVGVGIRGRRRPVGGVASSHCVPDESCMAEESIGVLSSKPAG